MFVKCSLKGFAVQVYLENYDIAPREMHAIPNYKKKQVLANVGYPQTFVGKVIHNKVNKLFIPPKDDGTIKMNFLVQLYNVSRFKQSAHRINVNLISHVRACASNTITPYHKPYKISPAFSTRPKISKLD